MLIPLTWNSKMDSQQLSAPTVVAKVMCPMLFAGPLESKGQKLCVAPASPILFLMAVAAVSRLTVPKFRSLLPMLRQFLTATACFSNPVFYLFIFTKIASKPVWWIVIYLLFPIGFILSSLQISKLFDKKIFFAVGLILLPIIFYPMLAFGRSSLNTTQS